MPGAQQGLWAEVQSPCYPCGGLGSHLLVKAAQATPGGGVMDPKAVFY